MELICGDSTIEMSRMRECSVDMVMTSPPYDGLRDYNGFDFHYPKTIEQIFRILKWGGVCVWVTADATVDGGETGTSFREALCFQSCGFKIHDTMIWEKPTFTATGALRSRYGQVFEYMFVFSKGKPRTFNPIMDRPNKTAGTLHKPSMIRQADGSFRRQSPKKVAKEYGQRFNVWHMPTVVGKERSKHPAPYPVKLCEDHIRTWTNKGDKVLDPFCGSGSTGVACARLGRDFVGIDISQEYIDLSKSRIERLS